MQSGGLPHLPHCTDDAETCLIFIDRDCVSLVIELHRLALMEKAEQICSRVVTLQPTGGLSEVGMFRGVAEGFGYPLDPAC